MFLACKFSRKTTIKFQKCFSITQNSSLTIIWDNLGLSNYKRMKRNIEFREKNTCYDSKRNYSVPYSKENPFDLMHLWHLSTIPSFWQEYFAERL